MTDLKTIVQAAIAGKGMKPNMTQTQSKDVAKGLVDAMMRARNRMSTEYPEYKEKQYFRPSRFAPPPKSVEAAEKKKKRREIAKTTNVDYTTETTLALFRRRDRKSKVRTAAKLGAASAAGYSIGGGLKAAHKTHRGLTKHKKAQEAVQKSLKKGEPLGAKDFKKKLKGAHLASKFKTKGKSGDIARETLKSGVKGTLLTAKGIPANIAKTARKLVGM